MAALKMDRASTPVMGPPHKATGSDAGLVTQPAGEPYPERPPGPSKTLPQRRTCLSCQDPRPQGTAALERAPEASGWPQKGHTQGGRGQVALKGQDSSGPAELSDTCKQNGLASGGHAQQGQRKLGQSTWLCPGFCPSRSKSWAGSWGPLRPSYGVRLRCHLPPTSDTKGRGQANVGCWPQQSPSHASDPDSA